jgi:hypothetical protein
VRDYQKAKWTCRRWHSRAGDADASGSSPSRHIERSAIVSTAEAFGSRLGTCFGRSTRASSIVAAYSFCAISRLVRAGTEARRIGSLNEKRVHPV